MSTVASTPDQERVVAAMTNTLADFAEDLANVAGVALTTRMVAASLALAAGRVLTAAPMEERMRATEDLKRGLDLMLARPHTGVQS